MEPLHDEQLLRELGTGGEPVLIRVFARYFSRLAGYCHSFLRNRTLATEAVMDTLWTLWEKRKEVAVMKSPEAWLYTCAGNRAKNMLRSEQRRGMVGIKDDFELPDAAVLEEELDIRETLRLFQKAIERLPQRQREIIELAWRKGWTRQQIAKHYGLSESTVKNHMTEAQRNLQRILKGFLLNLLM
ncbi:MAG TPA: sigma-70 family RNA polymerase sigma factor [Flavisolibacter sp.]|jgi:RNA polymerase sigma-70 factor (ECF subfamily)|nr:sigma-70 family RNA polymerase sigma factor [Flavisolibacter sp.]